MKKAMFRLLLLALASALSSGPADATGISDQVSGAGSGDAARQLLGMWDSQPSRGGMGATYEFVADGSMTTTFGVIAHADYRRDGDRILVEMEDKTTHYYLEGGVLIEVLGPGISVRYVSDGPATGDGLIDRRWRSETPAGGALANMFKVFTTDGKMLLRIPFQTQTGTYSVSGDALVMECAGSKIVATFRVEGDSMFLAPEDGGKIISLKRPGHWQPGLNEADRLPDEVATPRVVAGEGFLTRRLLVESEHLGPVSDIRLGELDPSPGLELGIAGAEGALFLDPENGRIVASTRLPRRGGHVMLVDVDGDGESELLNRGGGWQPVSLFDHSGNELWSFRSGPNDLAAGDLDGDGALDFVIGTASSLRRLDRGGRQVWKRPDVNVWHVEILDTDGDGDHEIVHSNGRGMLLIRDAEGRVLESLPPLGLETFSLCPWPRAADPAHLIAWNRRHRDLRLIDLRGDVVKSLPAPGSRRIGGIWGTPVRFSDGGPRYLAVLLRMLARWNRSILYLYDPGGTVVFHEVLDARGEAIAVLPAAREGDQRLLVGGDGKVWEYTLADS